MFRHETVTVGCPHCGKDSGCKINHLFGEHGRSWGPWYCGECGGRFMGTVGIDGQSAAIEKIEGGGKIETLVLLRVTDPCFVVVRGMRFADHEDNSEYFYNEHTCPTNWAPKIEAFIQDGDTDPHGVAGFVRVIDMPSGHDEDDADWLALFPETAVQP